MSDVIKDAKLVGMNKQAVIELLRDKAIIFRITKEDNVSFMGTADLQLERLNLEIKNGKVVKITRG